MKTETIPNKCRLYFLVRTDMASMTAGRIAAQVSHATHRIEQIMANYSNVWEDYERWKNETDYGFGTAVVLDGGTKQNIYDALNDLSSERLTANEMGEKVFHVTDFVIDPEYVLKDGDTVHLIPDVPTVAVVFVSVPEYHDKYSEVLSKFPLLGA